MHRYVATLHFEDVDEAIVIVCTSEAPIDKEQMDNQIAESFDKAVWGLEEVTSEGVGRFLARELKNIFPFICEVNILPVDTTLFVSEEK